MDLTAEAIEKIEELSAANEFTVIGTDGKPRTFTDKPLHEVIEQRPAMTPGVSVTTIQGFVDLVKAKLEDVNFVQDFFIQVENYKRIRLLAKKADAYSRRLLLAEATPVEFEAFPFNIWLDQEKFVIALASQFADGGDKDYVLSMAASLVNEAVDNREDDGFTQKVNIRAGLRNKGETTIKPRVSLAPFRTFPEATQPLSEFVFRARCPEGQTPSLMLVEADGGRWKVEAMRILREKLESYDLGIAIVS